MNDRLQVAFDDPIVTVSLQGKTTMMLSIEAVVRAVWMARNRGARGILFDIRDSVSDDFHSRKPLTVRPASERRIGVLGLPADPRLRFIDDVAVNRGIRARTFTDPAIALAWLADGHDGHSKVA